MPGKTITPPFQVFTQGAALSGLRKKISDFMGSEFYSPAIFILFIQ